MCRTLVPLTFGEVVLRKVCGVWPVARVLFEPFPLLFCAWGAQNSKGKGNIFLWGATQGGGSRTRLCPGLFSCCPFGAPGDIKPRYGAARRSLNFERLSRVLCIPLVQVIALLILDCRF